MIVLPDRRWLFHVKRGHSPDVERLEVVATSSSEAIGRLPADVTSWDFATFDSGEYSIPLEQAA